MASVFNMLRSNDLIWPYVINNYLKGKAPFPFDLLYWNSDATRLPAANHSFYLRNCYLENKLSKGKMILGNTLLDLKAVKIPIYNLATREDHIAPAKSAMFGSKFFGGPVKFVRVRLRAISPAWSIRRPRRNINIGPVPSRVMPISTAGSPRPRNIRARGGPIGCLADAAKPDRSGRPRSWRRRA